MEDHKVFQCYQKVTRKCTVQVFRCNIKQLKYTKQMQQAKHSLTISWRCAPNFIQKSESTMTAIER